MPRPVVQGEFEKLTEEVAALQIPMQNVLLVDVLQSEHALCEPACDLLFGEGLMEFLRLLDALVEVAACVWKRGEVWNGEEREVWKGFRGESEEMEI